MLNHILFVRANACNLSTNFQNFIPFSNYMKSKFSANVFI